MVYECPIVYECPVPISRDLTLMSFRSSKYSYDSKHLNNSSVLLKIFNYSKHVDWYDLRLQLFFELKKKK